VDVAVVFHVHHYIEHCRMECCYSLITVIIVMYQVQYSAMYKAKLSLCLNKNYSMKTYGEWMYKSKTHLDLRHTALGHSVHPQY
jgi:hypothetical protein